MKSLNSLLLEGNVVRDPVVKTTPNGKQLCLFTIAANRNYKILDGYTSEVSYFDIESWGNVAEIAATNCKTGRGVRVTGRIKQNRWIGSDGKHYSKITVVAEHLDFKPNFNKKDSEKSKIEEDENTTETIDNEISEISMEQNDCVPIENLEVEPVF